MHVLAPVRGKVVLASVCVCQYVVGLFEASRIAACCSARMCICFIWVASSTVGSGRSTGRAEFGRERISDLVCVGVCVYMVRWV